MSGRGRGRGKGGYTPPTGAQLFLKRSAQECGLDSGNLRALQDVTRPLLYPELRWHSNGTIWQPESEEQTPSQPTKRSMATVYLIQKQREIHRRMQTSVSYVRPTLETDVVRYRPRTKRPRTCADRAMLDFMGKLATPAFVPEELLMNQQIVSKIDVDGNVEDDSKFTLEELEARESLRRETSNNTAVAATATGETAEDDAGNLSDVVDEEEEEGEDYVMNYYESEEDSDGGGDDAEPTF